MSEIVCFTLFETHYNYVQSKYECMSTKIRRKIQCWTILDTIFTWHEFLKILLIKTTGMK